MGQCAGHLKFRSGELADKFVEMDVEKLGAVTFASFVKWWDAAKARQVCIHTTKDDRVIT